MCGRFTLEPTARFYERFHIENRLDSLVARYNIAPSQAVPVIISKSPNRVMLMRWGLIPHWAKDPKIGYKMINARIETLKEKPSFRDPLKHKRCLVPASGFYEWQAAQGGKVPHYIHLKDTPLFAFAGLYDSWHAQDGKEICTFTIITTESQGVMQNIHDRMPVIVRTQDEDAWVNSSMTDADTALGLLHNNIFADFDEREVSKAVNKPENDFAELLSPIA